MPKNFLSPKLVKFLAVALVCFLLIFLNPRGFFDPARGIFLRLAYPFQKTFYLLSRTVSGTFSFLGSISDLKEENADLLKENNSLSASVAMLEAEKKENEDLRVQLDLAPREKFELEAGFVIGQDPQKLGSWLMIDKGSADGIREGMPVIAYEGILAGKISEVFSGSSRVILLSDSESAVNAFDLETGARGVLKGEYGLGVVLDMVSQAEVMDVGDAVVTSGLGSEMPKGLLVGKIQEVKTSGDKLFQQAIVVPRIKYSKLETVFVIKK